MNSAGTPYRLVPITETAVKKFKGQMPELEAAIGMLFVGQQVGWKVLYLSHSKVTIRKYEKILGIKVRDVCPEVGPLANKSVAWAIGKKVSNFWKEVSGNLHGARSAQLK